MIRLPRKAIIFLSYAKLLFKPGWIMPKPIYYACGLLIAASILMMSLVNGLKKEIITPKGANNNLIYEPLVNETKEPVVVIQPQPVIKPTQLAPVTNSREYDKEKPRWPLYGEIIKDFGWQQHPVYKDWRYHNGIDIAAGEGQPVQAVLGGIVEEIYNDKNYGQTVVVKSGRYRVIYGSLAAVAVDKNDAIENGAKIGVAGTYIAEPGVHVHLAIKEGDKFINPRILLK